MISTESITTGIILADKCKTNYRLYPKRGTLLELIQPVPTDVIFNDAKANIDITDKSQITAFLNQALIPNYQLDAGDEVIVDDTLETYATAIAKAIQDNYAFITSLVLPEISELDKLIQSVLEEGRIKDETDYGFKLEPLDIPQLFLSDLWKDTLSKHTCNSNITPLVLHGELTGYDLVTKLNPTARVDMLEADFFNTLTRDPQEAMSLLSKVSYHTQACVVNTLLKFIENPYIDTGLTAEENKDWAINTLDCVICCIRNEIEIIQNELASGKVISNLNPKGFDILHIKDHNNESTIKYHPGNLLQSQVEAPLEAVLGGLVLTDPEASQVPAEVIIVNASTFADQFKRTQSKVLSTSSLKEKDKIVERTSKAVLEFLHVKDTRLIEGGVQVDQIVSQQFSQCCNEDLTIDNLDLFIYKTAKYVVCNVLYQGTNADKIVNSCAERLDSPDVNLNLSNLLIEIVTGFVMEQLDYQCLEP